MNCTDCVKGCVEHNIYDLVNQYAKNKDVYVITKREKFKFENELIRQELQYISFSEDVEFLNYMSIDEIVNKITTYQANKRRVRNRLVKRVRYFMDKCDDQFAVYFVTLTFSDDYLIGRQYEEIRTDIRKFVSKYANYYILNKDYGEHTERLHFHGLLLLQRDSELKSNMDVEGTFLCEYNRKFGFCNLQLCNENSTALTMYIEKLTFHALKLTTRKEYREHIIYSRLSKEERRQLGFDAKYNTIVNYIHNGSRRVK